MPGIAARDVDVHVVEDTLFLTGTSEPDAEGDGRVYVHAEIPRGPFRRVVPLPCNVSSRSHVEIDRGVVRIHLRKAPPPGGAAAERRGACQRVGRLPLVHTESIRESTKEEKRRRWDTST